jgi:membrane associated rhomboid family serine protease
LEDVAILTCVAVAALGVTAAYIVADVFGMIIGLGWGYYSKKRKAAKAAKREF